MATHPVIEFKLHKLLRPNVVTQNLINAIEADYKVNKLVHILQIIFNKTCTDYKLDAFSKLSYQCYKRLENEQFKVIHWRVKVTIDVTCSVKHVMVLVCMVKNDDRVYIGVGAWRDKNDVSHRASALTRFSNAVRVSRTNHVSTWIPRRPVFNQITDQLKHFFSKKLKTFSVVSKI